MSRVWRQIGIMYQEITSSKKALDRIQERTEIYVNGTILTIDSMEGNVGLITTRMQVKSKIYVIKLVGLNLNFFIPGS